MKCSITDLINNESICDCDVLKFTGRTIVLKVPDEHVEEFKTKIISGETDDGSFKGELKFNKTNKNAMYFHVKEMDIFDKRRYLRVPLRKEITMFRDRQEEDAMLVEIAYMSCKLVYMGNHMDEGEHVVVRIKYDTGDMRIDGKVFKCVGSSGTGENEVGIYIINFWEKGTDSFDADRLYSFIHGIANNR